MSDLQKVLASAASGAGASLLLEGGIGAGKSYLLRTAVRTARAHGFETVSLRARPSGTALTCDVLRQLHPGPPAPSGASTERADTPEAAADRLQQLIGALGPRTPLLIAVDDLHWADHASLRWLERLTARLEALPVALLATLTPGLAPPRDDLARGCTAGSDGRPGAGAHGTGACGGARGDGVRADGVPRDGLRGEGGPGETTAVLARVLSDFHQRTVLPGLDPDAVGYLLASFFGRPVAEALVHACHRHTGGNPLLVHALLRELRRVGTATEPACEQLTSLGCVEVAETVVARFEERFPGVGRALDAVAVAGRAGTAALVAELAGLPRGEAADMLHTLVRCGVLQETGGPGGAVAFAQPMMPVSFRAALPPSEHARLHAAAAHALHACGAPAPEVVHHLRHAPRIGARWAYRLLFDSAGAALSRNDLAQARVLLERCVQEGEPGDQPELLRRLSRVALAADAPATAVSRLHGLDRPRHAGDTAALASLVNLAQALALDGDLDGARRTLRGALTDLGPLDPAEEPAAGAFAVLGVLTLLTGGDDTPLPVPAATAARTPWVRCAQATLAALAARGRGGRREEAVRHARTGLGEPLGPADVPTTPLRLLLAHLLWDAGEHDEALEVCRALAAAAREEGARTMAALADTALAVCAYRAGRLGEAAEAARAALVDGPAGTWLGGALARCWLGGVLLETGDLDGARRLLLNDLALTGLPEPALPGLLFHRGRLHATLGHTQAGLADLEECGRQLARGAHLLDPLPWRAAAAALHAQAGDTATAERLAREELDLARAWGAPHAVAAALHTLALVARGGQRAALLHEAAGLLQDSGAWLEQARVLRSLGHELRRLRKVRQARDQLRAALALAEKCGADALANALRDDLASTGARPRRSAETGLHALTPAEHRTALLAAKGLTNKEIADRLYVTRRTVELHLSRVYRKLSVTGRSDLPAAVADLLPDPARRTLRRVDAAVNPPDRPTRSVTLRPAS